MENRRELVRKLVRRVISEARHTHNRDRPIGDCCRAASRSRRQPKQDQDDAVVSIECPISLKRRGVEMRMVVTNSADRIAIPIPACPAYPQSPSISRYARRWSGQDALGRRRYREASTVRSESHPAARLPLAIDRRQHPRRHPARQPDSPASLPPPRPSRPHGGNSQSCWPAPECISRASQRCTRPNVWNEKQATRDGRPKLASQRRKSETILPSVAEPRPRKPRK